MAYILEKFIITVDEKGKEVKTPISNKEKSDFIVLHNHQNGRAIRQTETQLIALEENEVFINGKVIIDEEYYKRKEEEAKKKELERITNLKLTKRVFALALQELGITYQVLKQTIAKSDQAQLEWDLCVELHRNNPLLDIMAAEMGITPEMLDYIFRKGNGEDVEIPTEVIA